MISRSLFWSFQRRLEASAFERTHSAVARRKAGGLGTQAARMGFCLGRKVIGGKGLLYLGIGVFRTSVVYAQK